MSEEDKDDNEYFDASDEFSDNVIQIPDEYIEQNIHTVKPKKPSFIRRIASMVGLENNTIDLDIHHHHSDDHHIDSEELNTDSNNQTNSQIDTNDSSSSQTTESKRQNIVLNEQKIENKKVEKFEDLKKNKYLNKKDDKQDIVIPLISDVKSILISDNDNENKTEIVINKDLEVNEENIEMTPTESIQFLICLVLAQISALFIISSFIHWIYHNLGGLDWKFENYPVFSFHVFFMSLSITGFGTGLLCHRTFRGLSSGALNFLHTIITIVTAILIFSGIYAVVVSVNSLKKPHFYTIHSWLGLLSIMCFTIEWISGVIIFIFPRFIPSIQRLLSPVHAFFGRICFGLLCGTAIVGISDKLQIKQINEDSKDISEFSNDSHIITVDPSFGHTIYFKIGFDDIYKKHWNMTDEALICNIIAFVLLFYGLIVIYILGNEGFRRRPSLEEQGIQIRTDLR